MAKSSSFFGLRKGSTKSLTFQTYRGQQITKDRVLAPANPQTDSQMRQRLLVPIVASARSILKTLVNHSFEGVTYGETSLKEFSSLNLSKGALDVTSYVPKGAMDPGLSNLIISRGSLPTMIVKGKTKFDNLGNQDNPLTAYGDFEVISLKAVKVPAEERNSDQLTKNMVDLILDNNPILKRGDQITILCNYWSGTYDYEIAKDEVSTAYNHRFLISRLILDETIPQPWRYSNGEMMLTDGYISFGLVTDNEQAEGDKPAIVTNGSSFDEASRGFLGACIILSRKDGNTWKRSSQRITVFDDVRATPSYNDVIYTYSKNSAESSRYLNKGLDGVDIPGGSVQQGNSRNGQDKNLIDDKTVK